MTPATLNDSDLAFAGMLREPADMNEQELVSCLLVLLSRMSAIGAEIESRAHSSGMLRQRLAGYQAGLSKARDIALSFPDMNGTFIAGKISRRIRPPRRRLR